MPASSHQDQIDSTQIPAHHRNIQCYDLLGRDKVESSQNIVQGPNIQKDPIQSEQNQFSSESLQNIEDVQERVNEAIQNRIMKDQLKESECHSIGVKKFETDNSNQRRQVDIENQNQHLG